MPFFHGDDRGSNPLGDATISRLLKETSRAFLFCAFLVCLLLLSLIRFIVFSGYNDLGKVHHAGVVSFVDFKLCEEGFLLIVEGEGVMVEEHLLEPFAAETFVVFSAHVDR